MPTLCFLFSTDLPSSCPKQLSAVLTRGLTGASLQELITRGQWFPASSIAEEYSRWLKRNRAKGLGDELKELPHAQRRQTQERIRRKYSCVDEWVDGWAAIPGKQKLVMLWRCAVHRLSPSVQWHVVHSQSCSIQLTVPKLTNDRLSYVSSGCQLGQQILRLNRETSFRAQSLRCCTGAQQRSLSSKRCNRFLFCR